MEEDKALIIALDAGHGASRGRLFTGASANGLVEDELALDFVKRIGHHLRAEGHSTVYTRSDVKLVVLAERGKIAKNAHCELFLSIHCNAASSKAHGAEAFVAEGDSRSLELGLRLLSAICTNGMSSRGAKWDNQSQYSRLRVLRDTYKKMPAVLLEVGFLTNPDDAALLADRFFREKAARAIAQCICTVK